MTVPGNAGILLPSLMDEVRRSSMATITVITGEPPYGRERVYSALRFSLAALSEGHRVNMFIFEDAVWAAKKGQAPPEFPGALDEHMPNCEELIKAVLRQGGKIKACGVCSTERALRQEELISGVEIASMKDLVSWVLESDKVVSF